MRIRVGVDLDDTLCDFTTPLNSYYKEKYATDLEVWCEPPEKVDLIIRDFINNFSQADLQPISGSIEFFASIDRDLYEFYLISARDSDLQDCTEQWLEKYFPGVFKKVILCNYHNEGPKRCKTDVCKELGARIMIDDIPDNIKCSSITTLPFCYPPALATFNWQSLKNYFSLPSLATRLACNMPPKLTIALSGKYGSGKDAAAAIIKKHFPSFVCFAFADRLKRTVATLTGVPVEMLYTREGKASKADGFEETLGQMLQTMGDKMKEVYGDDIWTRLTVSSAKREQHAIITDCRCLVEAEAVVKLTPHLLIRINGDPVGLRRENKDNRNLNHSSETELDDYPFERVIENDGTLEEFETKLLRVVSSYIYSLACEIRCRYL